MAKIVQVITRPSTEYDIQTAEAQVRDLDAIVEKLNSTFQEELAGTPSVTVTNNSITAIKSAALTANVTTELLTQPLVVEGGNTLTVLSSNTDSFDVAVSYLNIKKEITT